MKINYIPLGTRCSSAFVIRDNFKKRECSLPFDWLDMPITAITNFLSFGPLEIDEKIDEYFKELGTGHKHTDGTWFPHDIEFIDKTWKLKTETKDKFLKRLKRFNDLIQTENNFFLFLTVILEKGMYKTEDFNKLKELIDSKVHNCAFITINLGHESDFQFNNHFNLSIPQLEVDPGLKEWEKIIYENIESHAGIKKYIEENGGDI